MSNAANKATETKTRALEDVARCKAELAKAMRERDAIEECCSAEWRMAHLGARFMCAALANALEHAYQVGAMARPYWAA